MIESIGQMGRAGPRFFMHQRLLTWTAGVIILLAATSACAIHLPCKLLVAEPPRPFHPGPGDVISYDVTVDAGYADGHYQYFRTGTNGVGTIVIDTILSSVPVAAPGYRFEYLARPGSLIVPIGPLPAGAYTVTSTVRYYDVASASLYDACPPLSRTLTVYAESGPTVVAPVVEYHNATLDRHFMTQFAFEIEKLDASADWKRTGEAFLAYRPDLSDGRGTAIVRLYGMPAAGLDAHFWSWDYVELNTLWQWMHETDDAFELPIPDIATGLCRRGLLPVYRLWNGRADADHRYTTSVETRQALIDAGWVPEGYGAEGVAMCALQ